MSRTPISRRRFLSGSALATAGLVLAPCARVSASRRGPNDTVRLAVIGCGGMGSAHIYALAYEEGVELAALCDVYKPRYEKLAENVNTIYTDQRNMPGKKPDGIQDFRHILDRDDIDAILIATPDHWHPLIAILGCQSGKDVYVEKPVCTTMEEGLAMIAAARRYGRVVQVGTQQRSMPVFHEAMKIIHSGTLGPITTASAWIGTNGGIEQETSGEIPEGLDWDLWLGPAPKVPFTPQRFGAFRAFHDYARGGELANWGVHLMDIVHWGIGEQSPLNVQAVGGSYRQNAGADDYEVIDALFEYPGCTVTWEQRHTNSHAGMGYGMKFQGPEGELLCDRGRMVVRPEGRQIGEVIFDPEKSWANPTHHQNFFDCIRTRRRPAADIEQGFRATAAVLMAGIALKCDRKLHWDADHAQFRNDDAANRYCSRPYRAPWHL